MKIIPLGGGIKEIGGNKFIFEHKGVRVLLDIGMSFRQFGKFFDEFMRPRKSAGLDDFFELGLLPDIKGLYRNDYLKQMGRGPEEKGFDAVFISHAHADHAAYLHFVRGDIPIICTKATKLILQALEETGVTGLNEFINMLESFVVYKNTRGGFSKVTKATTKQHPEFLKQRDFITDEKIKIKGIELQIVPVDHSLPGASALLIHTDEGNFVYTGDIRFHGEHSDLSEKFVEIASQSKPKLMLCEGTRINEDEARTEQDVKNEANNIVSKTKELVIASIPIRDLDRLNTLLQVAKENNRFLTLSLKQAYLLDLMEKNNIDAPKLSDSNVKIYIPRKGWGLICKDCKEELKLAEYATWERPFLNHSNKATYQDVHNNQGKYILQLNMFDINQLLDVKPKQGSNYIRSTCEPFDIEMELDEKRLKNWLEHFKLGELHQIHASGHASQSHLKAMIDKIKPEVVIPIHTEHPELFKEIVPAGTKIEFLTY